MLTFYAELSLFLPLPLQITDFSLPGSSQLPPQRNSDGKQNKQTKKLLPKEFSANTNERDTLNSGVMILKEHESGYSSLLRLFLSYKKFFGALKSKTSKRKEELQREQRWS